MRCSVCCSDTHESLLGSRVLLKQRRVYVCCSVCCSVLQGVAVTHMTYDLVAEHSCNWRCVYVRVAVCCGVWCTDTRGLSPGSRVLLKLAARVVSVPLCCGVYSMLQCVLHCVVQCVCCSVFQRALSQCLSVAVCILCCSVCCNVWCSVCVAVCVLQRAVSVPLCCDACSVLRCVS